MAATLQQPMQQLVEELRATGYYGSDLTVSNVAVDVGTRITAIRQLEVAGEQTASVWMDDQSSEAEARQIAQTLLPRIAALAEIVDRTYANGGDHQATSQRSAALLTAWQGVRRLIEQFSSQQFPEAELGSSVMSLVVALMVLRQLADGTVSASAPETFVASSSGVHPDFFDACVHKLGSRPFDATDGSSLVDLSRKIAAFARSLPSPTSVVRA